MDPGTASTVVMVFLLLFIVIVLSMAMMFIIRLGKTADRERDSAEDGEAVEEVGGNRAARRRNARGRMGAADLRHRHQAQQPAAQVRRVDDDTSSSELGSDEEEDDEGNRRKLTKKEKKQKEKRERQEERQAAMEARRAEEERRAMPSAYEERMRQREADREAREKAEEEAARRAAEEKQRKEDEEASKWMGMISVEAEGTDAQTAEQTDGLLGQFVDYIISRKTVPLEQLAMDFKMRTQEVIDRIRGLEEMGRLTGVMDDRGKYIYISLDEMKSVASYLTSKGRVSISELASKSASLIDLEAKAAAASALHAASAMDFDAVLAA